MVWRELEPQEVDLIKVVSLFATEPAEWPENLCTFEGTFFRRPATAHEECAIALGQIFVESTSLHGLGERLFGETLFVLSKVLEKVIFHRDRFQEAGGIFATAEWREVRLLCQELLIESGVSPIPIRKPIVVEEKIELYGLLRPVRRQPGR